MPKRRNNVATEWLGVLRPGRVLQRRSSIARPNILPIGILVIVWFLLVLLQLYKIQVLDGARYRSLANGNRLRERVIYAPRGQIKDRNGVVLAENTVTSQLVVFPYLLKEPQLERKQEISKIAAILKRTEASLTSELDKLNPSDINAHVLATKLDQSTTVQLESAISTSSAFILEDVPSRRYVSDYGLAHVLGYTGLVTPENLQQDVAKTLLPTDRVGQAGVESAFDTQLRGTNGREKIEVDATSRPISLIAKQQPVVGKDLKLTIDVSMQKALYESTLAQMQKAKSTRAASVAIDPNNGDVLAMVSLPAYDNNEFVDGISQERYNQLQKDPMQPLLNKVLSNGYATGSIIKPLVASAALQERIVTPETTIVDRGYIELQSQFDSAVRYRYNGWNLAGLGAMQVRSAIAFSSNIYFYTVGGGYESQPGLGVSRLTKYYRLFGLGELSGINLPNEQPGRVPDPAWKQQAYGEDWFVGDTYNISIGQGDMSVSPLQITLAEAAITNSGKLYRPRISLDESIVIRREIPINHEHFAVVREGMRQTIVRGTTPQSMFSRVPVHVAAKSGTAETNSPGGKPPHSWYTAFAPYEKPEVLTTVLIEEGREGVSYSAPAIADFYATYFKGRQP